MNEKPTCLRCGKELRVRFDFKDELCSCVYPLPSKDRGTCDGMTKQQIQEMERLHAVKTVLGRNNS